MTTPARLSDERLRQLVGMVSTIPTPANTDLSLALYELLASREAESRAPEAAAMKPLTSRERRKGTGDVLKYLAHAQHMTDTSEPGFGEVICRGQELDFVNRAIRVAVGEINQLRLRVKPAAPEAARAQTWQPIETHNGTKFVALVGWQGVRDVQRGFFDRGIGGGMWRSADRKGNPLFDPQPTHWMPLPPTP